MEWKLTSKELPEIKNDINHSQVKCLVNKKYFWKRGDITGSYYRTQILVFNHDYKCWDSEDGDDYDCDINQVIHWAYLPEPPIE